MSKTPMSDTQEKRPQEAEFVDWCCRYGTGLEEIVYPGSALRKTNTIEEFSEYDVEYLREAYDDLYKKVIAPRIESAKREALKELPFAHDTMGFCEHFGEQFRPCAKCVVDKRLAQLEQSEESI